MRNVTCKNDKAACLHFRIMSPYPYFYFIFISGITLQPFKIFQWCLVGSVLKTDLDF